MNKILFLFLFSGGLILSAVGFGSAQTPAPRPAASPPKPKIDKSGIKTKIKLKGLSVSPIVPSVECEEEETRPTVRWAPASAPEAQAEKSIEVNGKVAVTLCVSQGEVKINGWNRNEIRAFVNRGSQVGFSVLAKSENKKPVHVKVLGYDPTREEEGFGRDECLYGKLIQLDVPFGASVKIKSRESKMTIESVTKAWVENSGGSVFFNNVSQGIDAKTFEGNVTVRNSSGAMTLETTTGNIVAYEASSDSFGDFFRARTIRGAITLQQIGYRDTEVNTNSGSINFIGKILSGGQYYFGSSESVITLFVPEDTSAKIVAFYGYGQLVSEFLFKEKQKENNEGLQSFNGIIGGGDARINFKTVHGKIYLRKQKPIFLVDQ